MIWENVFFFFLTAQLFFTALHQVKIVKPMKKQGNADTHTDTGSVCSGAKAYSHMTM